MAIRGKRELKYGKIQEILQIDILKYLMYLIVLIMNCILVSCNKYSIYFITRSVMYIYIAFV